MSPKKLGRYELIRILGRGAMGIVYEGRDPNLDRRVAIKTVLVENLAPEIAAEYEARFRTEARSAARLQHPNIVSVYDSGRDGNVAFLVMEFVQGDDLKQHLEHGKRYSLAQAAQLVVELLSALDYAHQQGIVHRDVKPANLLIQADGRVKLTDFGVARMQDSGEATRTQGTLVGTLKYMSPEQVQGERIDSRADLFSVGIVLYQLLTDRRPFDSDNDFSIIHQIIGHTPAAPSSLHPLLPAAIDVVVANALAKDREQRFPSADAFAVALKAALRDAQDATVLPPAAPRNTDRGARSEPGRSISTAGSSVSGTATLARDDGPARKRPERWDATIGRPAPLQVAGRPREPAQGVPASTARNKASASTLPRTDAAEASTQALVTWAAGLTGIAVAALAAFALIDWGDRSARVTPARDTARAVAGRSEEALSPPPVVAAVRPDAANLAVVPASAAAPVPRQASSAAALVSAQTPAAADGARRTDTTGVYRRDSKPVRPAAVAARSRAAPQGDACKDKVFLARQYCLHVQCAKPALHAVPACVRFREQAKLREDSKVSY